LDLRRYSRVLTPLIAFSVLGIALALSGSSVGADGSSSQVGSGGNVFPLKVSESGRYLVDQRNVPFLMVGDSPQALIGNISVSDAETFIASRKAAGINTLWINLLCVQYTACRADGTTFDGIAPFTTTQDLSTPNEAYFARADAMISLAEKYGMLVFLDPIETGGWSQVIRDNGVSKDYAYGRYVGERYREFPNVIWFNGNDYQDWHDPELDAGVLAVARGIRSAQPNRLQTVQLNFDVSGSLDNRKWRNVIDLDAAYSYFPTYEQILKDYNRSNIPVFMAEAVYEFENIGSHEPGIPLTLRRQTYWSFLSGTTGQLYGNYYTWRFENGWKSHLDTPGSAQFGYAARLFATRAWHRLVPDQKHVVVTSGYGAFGSWDYATASATPNGTLAIAYMPTARTISVDMGKLAGTARAQWFDPTNGKYSDVSGSPFANAGTRSFTPPAKNSRGDSDWVLVLSASTRS